VSVQTQRPDRPIPALNKENESFWTCGAEGVLRILRCNDCGFYVHPPRPICPECLSWSVAPGPVSGAATVESFTINYRMWNPKVPPPYVIARVELDEQPGLYLVTNIVGIDPEAVDFGLRVTVTFEQVSESVFLPLFRPMEES
jgi:uncharacterized OB-fold protein